jgi:hypothetical protein
MASTITHLAVAKKVLEQIEVDNQRDYFLGAVAPDISKQVGQSREISHFLFNNQDDAPNINLFVKRYPLFKYNSFDLGYFTHLYTDKIWNESFLPTFTRENKIKLISGETVEATKEEVQNMIYSDYNSLNSEIIDEYQLDLSLFYEEYVPPKTNMKEIPIENSDILLNKIGIIIENAKTDNIYAIDFGSIKEFINRCADEIIKEIKKY